LTLEPGGFSSYNFDSASISLNPGEIPVSGSMSIPLGSFSTYSTYFITFGNSENDYDASLAGFVDRTFSFLIPSGIPSNFKTYVQNNITQNGSSHENFIVYPHISNVLNVKESCQLTNPSNNAENVTDKTTFSFLGGTGTGIYRINLYNTSMGRKYEIITDELNFLLEGIDKLGLGSINNNIFTWNVNKEGPADSMNDYVTGYPDRIEKFKTFSQSRQFTTSP